MSERNIFINDLKINFKISGQGETLLILHGWGGSSDSWKRVEDILATEQYRVIVPDLPGFGKSISPPRAWGVQDYSDFVLNFIEELGISQFFLLGHSFGGRIAIKFSVNNPQKVKKLILCDSAGIKPEVGFKVRLMYLIAKIGNLLFSTKPLARLQDRARNSLYVFLRNKDYFKANSVMKETIKKVLKEDLLPELPQIQTKTLLVWGQIDKLVPIKYSYIFKEKIKNSRLEILPKIGHSAHLEAPQKLAEIILKFIKE